MASEEVNIDRELIKAQASGKWEKRDYRTLRYVGYEAVEATIEASVSAGRFVWSWSVVTKDKALPFAGHAPTLDKAIEDAQWHIEQVASVEQQVDVISGLPSDVQTTPADSQPEAPLHKPDPAVPEHWTGKPLKTHLKAFAPAFIFGSCTAIAQSGIMSLVSFFLSFLFWLPVTVHVYKNNKFSWPFFWAFFVISGIITIISIFLEWLLLALIIFWIFFLLYAIGSKDIPDSSPTPTPKPTPQPRRLQGATQHKTGHEHVPNANINVSVDVDRQPKDHGDKQL